MKKLEAALLPPATLSQSESLAVNLLFLPLSELEQVVFTRRNLNAPSYPIG